MKAFFILDKWCQANKTFGPSAWEENFVTSFSSLGNYDSIVFHFDEYHDAFPGDSANQALMQSLQREAPDFIFLVIYERPGTSDKIISLETLRIIKEQLQIPIVTIFGDLEHIEQVKILETIEPYMTLVLFTALAPPGIRLNNPKLKYSWVPKSPVYFYRDINAVKINELAYFGSPKSNRIRLINYLERRGIPVLNGGGERQENIPVQDYAQNIRESKVCISFSRAAYCHVTNARVFEVISCGSMLLEQEGMETPKILKPFNDFIPFFSRKDCFEKAQYYLQNNAEREEISLNGYLKYQALFSSERFWLNIFEYLEASKKGQLFVSLPEVSSSQSGKNFWIQSILHRTIPIFNADQYKGFNNFRLIHYQFLDKVMVTPSLYLIYRWLCRCIECPRRILVKIKRIILIKKFSKRAL